MSEFSKFKDYGVPITRQEAKKETYEENYQKVIRIMKKLNASVDMIKYKLKEEYV